MTEIRPAATVMLTRDYKGVLEVLLLKRNRALAFAGGAWVFPGGKIDPGDHSGSKDETETAKRAAIRETKEEAGVLVEEHSLIFYRHWTTPANSPRRYGTWFFLGQMPENADPVKIDDSEIKEYLWLPPQRALEKYKAGQLPMLPPTVISLQLIRTCHSVAEARERLQQEDPIFVLPIVCPLDGKINLLYKGDAGYASGKADIPGARHRFVIDPNLMGGAVFVYENCEGFLPVNGGDTFF